MNKFKDLILSTNRTPIFVDLNNLLYRYFYVFKPEFFKSHLNIPNGHLFGLSQQLRTMDKLGYEIFLCEDSSHSWRKNLCENYKLNRADLETHQDFWKDFGKIRDLISDLDSAHTLYADGFEADDLMYSGAKICSFLGRDSLIFTADKDLMQSLDEHITIVKKITLNGNEYIKFPSDEYYSKFPVEPNKLPLYRAFKGDPSDNLKAPVPRLPKDLLLDLVDYISINSNLKDYKIQKNTHTKWIKQIVENWDSFINNYRIMKLSVIDFDIVDKSPKGSYKKICADYDLVQFSKYMEEL